MDLRCSIFNSPYRTILYSGKPGSDDTDLTPMYHIYTPYAFKDGTTVVSTISPSIAHDPTYRFRSGNVLDIKDGTEYDGDGIEEIGQIRWKSLGSTMIEFQGKVTKASDLLHHQGFLWKDRSFTGPDGLLYVWHNWETLTVKKSGETKETVVARFRQSAKLSVKNTLRDNLEITEEGMHMVDMIVVTWVYLWTQVMWSTVGVPVASGLSVSLK
ncbi:hypothetical protein BXZ70DRAFT_714406 [Cristinia sonorae]|uniref:DUF6593 domain-containing protein n=1 Tax=Cristinia sonorae TaxID=1940300 RepID=A0A8K0XS02_9AGAR|nr:hypothetical protein BXZ70DRAFT_714406 [Cristinia sonorae]